MSKPILKIENLTKQCRIGVVGASRKLLILRRLLGETTGLIIPGYSYYIEEKGLSLNLIFKA